VQVLYAGSNSHVMITDNGKGFDMQQTEKGYGLQNIQKRAEEMNAVLAIESNPGKGTIIRLILGAE
jgi:signal transduction histidine kinase